MRDLNQGRDQHSRFRPYLVLFFRIRETIAHTQPSQIELDRVGSEVFVTRHDTVGNRRSVVTAYCVGCVIKEGEMG